MGDSTTLTRPTASTKGGAPRRLTTLDRLVGQQVGVPVGVAGGGAAAGLVTWSITARLSDLRPADRGQKPETADRAAHDQRLHELIAPRWRPEFPSAELVRNAVQDFEHVPWDGGEGPRPLLYVGPGVIKVRYRDLGKQERTQERAVRRRQTDAAIRRSRWSVPLAELQARLDAGEIDKDTYPAEFAALVAALETEAQEPTREVREWSRKSRARMVETFAGLDWSPIQHLPWPPAMLTLTLPGDWLTVAPTGRAFKKLVRKFEKRWLRAWGFEPIWLWKLEFQRRGAPHLHMFAVLPPPSARAGDHRKLTPEEAAELGLTVKTRNRPAVGDGLGFREWLSEVWVDVVDHPDPAEREKHRAAGTGVDYAEAARLRDPRRMSVYFSKHGSFKDKDYQNVVPPEWQAPGAGPGRFWGFKGLRPAVVGATVQQEDALWAQRILRRYSRAQGVTAERTVPRGDVVTSKYADVIGLAGAQFLEAHRLRYRKVRRRVVRFAGSCGGFMCINDAPAFAQALSRAVTIAARPPDRAAARLPWERIERDFVVKYGERHEERHYVISTPAPTVETLKSAQQVEYYRLRRALAERRRWDDLCTWVDAHAEELAAEAPVPPLPLEVQQALSLHTLV